MNVPSKRPTVRAAAATLAALLACGPAADADYLTTTNDINGGSALGLRRYDEETGLRLTAGEVAPSSVSGIGPLAPADLALGPDGNVYATDAFTGTVFRVEASTSALVNAPIPALPDGVFAQRASAVFGLQFTSLAFGPNTLGSGPDTLLYVADSSDVLGVTDPEAAQPGIRVFDPATGSQVDTLLEGSGQSFGVLGGMAFLPDGDLLVSDLDAATVYRVDPATDTLSVFTVGTVFGPAGVAVSPDGDVFVADLFGNRVVKYDSTGANPETLIAFPPPANNFSNFPSDIFIDPNGDLVVALLGPDDFDPEADSAGGQLIKYDAETGALLQTIATGLSPTSSVVLVDDLLPGDFNGDGLVDTDDYAVLGDTFGATVPASTGADGNGDGVVNAADYTVWRDTLGDSGLLAPQTVTATPEPAGGALLVAAAAGWVRRRR
ncbi:MAG: hypothetical protein AAGJ46_02685 [Planctomycetota bacterium]